MRPSGLQLVAHHPDGHELAHPVTAENVLVVAERLVDGFAPGRVRAFTWQIEEA